jgi:DNA-binding response OmpR family regulator
MKKILIVDDIENVLIPLEKYFNEIGWDVITFDSADKLIDLINSKYKNRNHETVHLSDIQCLILDHDLHVAFGNEILKEANDKRILLPPTIILSGYLNEVDVDNYFQLGVKICCQKPVSPETLASLADLLIESDFNGMMEYAEKNKSILVNSGIAIKKLNRETIIHPFRNVPNQETINNEVNKRDHILKDYFENAVLNGVKQYLNIENPIFIIGRRWNSWYPSFFDVPGGAYILAMPEYKNKNEMALIDPGFKCLNVLSKKLNISVAEISTCIISHNHPDHIGGLFEYLACRNTLDYKCHLFCNPTTLKMFLNHRSIQQLDNVELDLLEDWDKANFEKILISGFKTAHNEIGPKNRPMAIEIKFLRPNNNTEKLIILGDTEYKDTFVNKIADNNLKVLVLHIGSAQLKNGTGKHLYLNGIRKLLHNLDNKLEHIGYRGKLLVLISEWGLEHATKEQLEKLCEKKLTNINDDSPIVETINYLRNELNFINILPADIGLIVDIIDQKIYTNINKNKKYTFSEIDYIANSDGIKYIKKGTH